MVVQAVHPLKQECLGKYIGKWVMRYELLNVFSIKSPSPFFQSNRKQGHQMKVQLGEEVWIFQERGEGVVRG